VVARHGILLPASHPSVVLARSLGAERGTAHSMPHGVNSSLATPRCLGPAGTNGSPQVGH
jgi:hypothetical protein